MIALIAALAVTLIVHEVGHALAASAWRLPWRPTLTRHGLGVVIGSDAIRLSRWQIATTCAAGPLANVALMLIALVIGLPMLALLSFVFAVANLVPLPHSDGSRVLSAATGR